MVRRNKIGFGWNYYKGGTPLLLVSLVEQFEGGKLKGQFKKRDCKGKLSWAHTICFLNIDH